MTIITWAQVDIYNMALSQLGESNELATVNDNVPGAKACNRFYDVSRQKCLRDAPWPFARKYADISALNVTSTSSPSYVLPISEYQFEYTYPTDALLVRRLLNGVSRIEDKHSRIPFKVAQGQGSTTKILLCDVEPVTGNSDTTQNVPWVEYTVDVTDTTQFSPDFVDAMAFLLAWRIGPRICADKSKLIDNAGALYTGAIIQARRAAFNEEAQDDAPLSEFEQAREGWPPILPSMNSLLELP